MDTEGRTREWGHSKKQKTQKSEGVGVTFLGSGSLARYSEPMEQMGLFTSPRILTNTLEFLKSLPYL